MSEISYEQRGAIAVITLNRPEHLNSFDAGLRVAARNAIARAAADESIRAVVLTGAGRGFSAGADLNGAQLSGDEVTRILEEEYNPAVVMLATMPKVTIAAVNGFAAGIAVGFALACDLVVMEQGGFMQIPFNRIGLIPDGGVCWQLVERLGHRRAFELSLEGERVPATRCVELGLANRAVPDGQALPEALKLAERAVAAAPVAVQHTKRVMREAATASFSETLRAEAQAQACCIDTTDFIEGVSAFLSKRTPRFTGR